MSVQQLPRCPAESPDDRSHTPASSEFCQGSPPGCAQPRPHHYRHCLRDAQQSPVTGSRFLARQHVSKCCTATVCSWPAPGCAGAATQRPTRLPPSCGHMHAQTTHSGLSPVLHHLKDYTRFKYLPPYIASLKDLYIHAFSILNRLPAPTGSH